MKECIYIYIRVTYNEFLNKSYPTSKALTIPRFIAKLDPLACLSRTVYSPLPPSCFFLNLMDRGFLIHPGFHRQISSSFHPPLKYSDTVDKIVPRY